ncbi:efflux RND transporter periplasmic adaptor subunit [Rhodoferax sp.]|uniref:efflux RND transporter periplasmic adaptor subunit n=1 Tax=Rhodoferax sp. TaxID=50421 RepID=UPI0025E3E0B8|nr:efflux RND transporter periplasmic adaptor subunit [Rhodoferax sp.]
MPKNKILRYALAALALLVLAAAIKLLFFPAPKKPDFVTATAALANLEQAVLATGTVQAFKQVSVGAQASGQIKSLKVALGDTVKKGQLVAEIDSLTQQNSLRTAEAALANVQAQLLVQKATLKQAELTYQREKTLLAADASARATFEAADAALQTARAQVGAAQSQITQAQIAVSTARLNLGYTQILAPIDGVVVALVAQEGQTVNANQSTPTIIKLARLDTITVKAQISEADVVRVQPGQKVYFTILGAPDKRYTTTLRTVEPAPDSILTDTTTATTTSASAIYYNGLLDVPNPEGLLRISMTAQVNIVLNEAKQVLSIPSAALGERDREGRSSVRVVDSAGQAVPRSVKVGLNNNVNAQILDGLAVGDRVVVGEASAASATGSGSTRMRPPPGM